MIVDILKSNNRKIIIYVKITIKSWN